MSPTCRETVGHESRLQLPQLFITKTGTRRVVAGTSGNDAAGLQVVSSEPLLASTFLSLHTCQGQILSSIGQFLFY